MTEGAGRTPEYVLDQIRQATKLSDLVRERGVKLEKKGKTWYGLCPFHNESTESFTVDDDDGLYGCFGCEAAGNAFQFLEAIDGLTFLEAVEELADRTGVELRNGKPGAEVDTRALKEAAEREKARQYEEAAVGLRKRWEAADKASSEHPYLKRKKIDAPKGIRQWRGDIIVPMFCVDKRGPDPLLMSLQTIAPDGTKRFASGGRALRTRMTIRDNDKPWKEATDPLYIVEGYATGWAIHTVTGHPVMVAFSANNLRHVAKAARDRYGGTTIIICADNDRWSRVRGRDGQDKVNPGVLAAMEAGEYADVFYAVPDFEHLEGEPTDFHDLLVREGPEAVEYWLDPVRADEARTVPEVEVEDETEEGEEPSRETWMDTARFRLLGYDHEKYYYLPFGTGQIRALTASQHKRENLVSIQGHSFWQRHWASSNGVSWTSAADALFRASEDVGVFHVTKLRGRGAWLEENEEGEKEGLVLHLGDRLLPPGDEPPIRPEMYSPPSRHIYERLPRMRGPDLDSPATLEESQWVLDRIFRGFLWQEEASGTLLAGWAALAPICGALSWRPHVWVIGDSGAGKSTLVEEVLTPLTGGMSLVVEGATTEAGIRQRLRSDAIPVVFDEAEKEDGAATDRRIQSVLALARAASSSEGGEVLKGTTHGAAMGFTMRSMFALSSISSSVRQEADKTRVCQLQLHSRSSKEPEERRAHWARFEPEINKLTVAMGRRLVARSLEWLNDGRLEETISTFQSAASTALGDTRAGDQYGTLYAGAWTLQSDEPPTAIEARELVGSEDLTVYLHDQAPVGEQVLQRILQHPQRTDTSNGNKTFAVGQLVERATGKEYASVTETEAKQALIRTGIRVDLDDGEWVLKLATTSDWIRGVLRDSPFGDNLSATLRTLGGVREGELEKFHAGLISRTVIVPFSVLGL